MSYGDLKTATIAGAKTTSGNAAAQSIAQNFSPDAVSTRQEARVHKANMDKELKKAQGTQYTDEDVAALGELQSQQIDLALNETRAANQQIVKQSTYSGLDRFFNDGSLRHLNKTLADMKGNSVSQSLPGFSDITTFEPIGATDEQLLKPLGLTPENFVDNPDLQKGWVKAILNDGSTRLVPTEALAVSTGYTQYADDRNLTRMERIRQMTYKTQLNNGAAGTAKERQAHLMTKSAMPAGMDEANWVPGDAAYDLAYLENLEQVNTTTPNATQDEEEARRETMLQQPDDVEDADWVPGNDAYDQAYEANFDGIVARDRETTAQRERIAVREAKSTIQQKAADREEDFFEINFRTDRAARLRYEDEIQDIERLGQLQLSNEDKRLLSSIHELTGLGEAGGEISADETGVLDRMFNSVRRYVSDNVDGIAATSSYAAFRNTIRHALYGSTLTDGEIAAFNEQMGNLGQQAGPVLQQFRTAMEQVRSKLESVQNLNDSYVSHFYTGGDSTDLNNMIGAIDERLAHFERLTQQTSSTVYIPDQNTQQAPSTSIQIDPANFVGQESAARLFNEIQAMQVGEQ